MVIEPGSTAADAPQVVVLKQRLILINRPLTPGPDIEHILPLLLRANIRGTKQQHVEHLRRQTAGLGRGGLQLKFELFEKTAVSFVRVFHKITNQLSHILPCPDRPFIEQRPIAQQAVVPPELSRTQDRFIIRVWIKTTHSCLPSSSHPWTRSIQPSRSSRIS